MQDPLSVSELKEMFVYHAPRGDQPARYEKLRSAAHDFAIVITQCVSPSADRTAAIRKVREAVMTANAGIAINECLPEDTTEERL